MLSPGEREGSTKSDFASFLTEHDWLWLGTKLFDRKIEF